MLERRPGWMLTAVLAASLATMLLVPATSSAGASLPAPNSPIAALADRLIASPSVSAPTQLVGRLIASRGIFGFASDPAPVASTSRTKLPPDLIALERKMRTLHINSERGSIFVLLTGVNFGSLFKVVTSHGSRHGRVRAHRRGSAHKRPSTPRRGRGHRNERVAAQRALGLLPSSTLDVIPLLTADFESSVSPKLAIVRAEVLGAIPIQMRVIGEQLYMRSPLLTEMDGGRPWLYRSPAELAEAKAKEGKTSGETSALSSIGQPDGAEAGFTKPAALIGGAQSVVEIGKRTVDGQETIEFEAKLDLKRLRELLNPPSKREKRGSSKGAKRRSKRSPTKRPTTSRRALTPVKVTLDLYLAPNGLPVRTVLDIRRGEVSITLGLDIVATEIPIVVQPPPASETITGAELKKLEESGASEPHLSKREKAEERRFWHCMSRHIRPLRRHRKRLAHHKFMKIVRACERRAKLHPGPAQQRPHSMRRGGGGRDNGGGRGVGGVGGRAAAQSKQ